MDSSTPSEGGVNSDKQTISEANVARIERDMYKRRWERERELKLKLQAYENRVNDSAAKKSFDHLEHTDKSRKHIAYVFVYGYIILVAIIVIGVPLYNAMVLHKAEALELDKILAQMGALIGSPLGFVVGYYFKEDSRK